MAFYHICRACVPLNEGGIVRCEIDEWNVDADLHGPLGKAQLRSGKNYTHIQSELRWNTQN
jgi:hypothetical protein